MVILVAEDEAIVAVLLELTLLGAGHEVLGPAASVGEALRLAAATPPDLALLDVVLLDDGDGIALARALRDRHGTPVLFLSGQTTQARAASDAALGVVGKPYEPADVLAAVEAAGELVRGRRPAQVPRRLELFGWRGGT